MAKSCHGLHTFVNFVNLGLEENVGVHTCRIHCSRSIMGGMGSLRIERNYTTPIARAFLLPSPFKALVSAVPKSAFSRAQRSLTCLDVQNDGHIDNLSSNQVDTDDSPVVTTASGAILSQDPFAGSEAVLATVELNRELGETEILDKTSASATSPFLASLYAACRTWEWRGQNINHVVMGSGPPVLLIHGFGASIGHFRKNIPILAQSYRVHALDLLGQGASSKPADYEYTIEKWGELILDYLETVVQEPTVLLGNSVGSLSVLLASAEAKGGMVRGVVLLNCAGGMNNKAISDDWRIKAVMPIFWLIDNLLLQPSIARSLFNKFRSRKNVQTVLQSVYVNKAAVDDELIEIITKPAMDDGALDAFVSIITGPPGPRPETLVPKINHPILILWGDKDPFTPFDGPIGKYFRNLPALNEEVTFVELPDVGHCPHDDNPELLHEFLLPWLANLP